MMAFSASGIFSVICFVSFLETAQPKTLVVSSIVVQPFLSEIKQRSNGTIVSTYEGYIQELLDQVAKHIGKSYTFSIRKDGRFGQKLPNGSWDGIIGDVVDGRADLAAGPLTETSDRAKVVDFSTPFMNFGPVVIMKRPQAPVMTLEERLQRLFSPLTQSIWMMSGLAWFVTSVILYIICHINPYDWRRLAKDRQATLREGESFSCLNAFWFTVSNFLWQGYTSSPRSLGARIVVTFWWLYVLIFVVMYIASMTNYLRVGPTTQDIADYHRRIQSIEDLVQHNEISVGVLRAGSTAQFLEASRVKSIAHLWKHIVRHNTYQQSLEAAIRRVRTSRKPFALISESAMAKFYTKQSPCDIYMVGDFTTIGSYAFAFPQNSSLIKDVDIALLTLRENGILKELEDRWFSGECSGFVVESNRNKMQVPEFHGVDLGTFSGALIILAVGLIIGSLATIIEVVVFKFAEVGEKEKDKSNQAVNAHDTETKVPPVSSMVPEPITDV